MLSLREAFKGEKKIWNGSINNNKQSYLVDVVSGRDGPQQEALSQREQSQEDEVEGSLPSHLADYYHHHHYHHHFSIILTYPIAAGERNERDEDDHQGQGQFI